MTPEQRKQLLTIARESINATLEGRNPTPPESADTEMNEHCGAFVTLEKHGALRGCIGNIRGHQPLIQTISEMAVAAATHDPRFPPLTTKELNEIEIEISILTPLEKVTDTETIQTGKHGLFITSGPYSGLLLPQVATDWGWDRNTFLEQTCRKAGLPGDAWKQPETEIFSFTAEIFGEHEP